MSVVDENRLAAIEIYDRYKERGIKKFGKFRISFKAFFKLIQSDCHYCGTSPQSPLRAFRYNGLDRIDNSKGYYLNNVTPCCGKCNMLKGSTEIEDFLEQVLNIAQNQLNNCGFNRLRKLQNRRSVA